MADGENRIGLNGTFRFGAAGAQPASLDTYHVVQDVTCSMAAVEVNITGRGDTVDGDKPILLQPQLTIKASSKEGDPLVAAFLAAYTTLTPIVAWACEGPGDTGEGWDGDWYCTMNREEPLKGIVNYTITLKPATDSTRPPTWG